MASSDFYLLEPSQAMSAREQELRLQHAAGFILCQDMGDYARERLDPALDAASRVAAEAAIRDTMYGLMMIADGVTGSLRSDAEQIVVSVSVRRESLDGRIIEQMDLFDGDGACMGFHGWLEGDFGDLSVVHCD